MDVLNHSLFKEADRVYMTVKYKGVNINFDDDSWNS